MTQNLTHEEFRVSSEIECMVMCLNQPDCKSVNLRNITRERKACDLLYVLPGDHITVEAEPNSIILGKLN